MVLQNPYFSSFTPSYPTYSSTNRPLWDPTKTLKIINADPGYNRITCLGYAPSQGRRCRNPINASNRAMVDNLLNEISYLKPGSEGVKSRLRRIAAAGLCVRWHQGQVEDVVRNWERTIRAMGEVPRVEERRARRSRRWTEEEEEEEEEVKKESLADVLEQLRETREMVKKLQEEINKNKYRERMEERDEEEEREARRKEEKKREKKRMEEEKEKLEKERLERERLQKERLQKERLEKERMEKEKEEKQREKQREKERLEKERLEKEKREREEKARRAQEAAAANERIRQRAQKLREERERAKKEKEEREKQEWQASWQNYQDNWTRFKNSTSAKKDDIPWPVRSGLLRDVSEENAKEFFEKGIEKNEKRFKVLKRECIKWHPDMISRLQRDGKLELGEREREVFGMICRVLTGLLDRAAGRSSELFE